MKNVSKLDLAEKEFIVVTRVEVGTLSQSSPSLEILPPPLDRIKKVVQETRERESLQWWQDVVFYQIYPATFRDSNGDGIGDLKGIKESLDYLKYLGMGALWLSPVYSSPMNDGGYDVADYINIDPRFGTLGDFDDLVREADARGMRIIMDLVMNHSSSESPWFREARSAKGNSKRNWYTWVDPKMNGLPPNNWQSFFGGAAWEYDSKTGQYYLHRFDVTQPDLNMRNPEVREAMKNIIRFWLDRGIGGFRMDVLDYIFEDPTLADAEPNPNYKEGDPDIDRYLWPDRYFQFREVHEWTREVTEILHQYGAVGIGELGSNNVNHIANLRKAGLDLPFNFRLLNTPFEPKAVRDEVETYLSTLPEDAWPNFVLGNHDNKRLASKIGVDKVPMATTLLYTLPGTPFVYNGDEIGMENGTITPSQNKDPQGRPDRLGIEMSRDPARTPMQWDPSESAGFSKRRDNLWLPIGKNGKGRNVMDQMNDPNSLLRLTRDLIALRRENQALLKGKYLPWQIPSNTLYAYSRKASNQEVVVVHNFSNEPDKLPLPETMREGIIILSTNRKREQQHIAHSVVLQPYESCILDVTHTI